jgi:preprotein translocase subunit SecD
MRKKIQRRAIAILIVTLAGLYLVFLPHNRKPQGKDFSSWSRIKENLANNIHLGLDLRGGSHLVMQVQTDKVITDYTNKNVEQAKNVLQNKGWPFDEVKATGVDQITITVPDRSHNSDIIAELKPDFNNLIPGGTGWTANEIGNSIVFRLDQSQQNSLRDRATEMAQQIIENRVNAFGVSESTIQRVGSNDQYQILLEMPGIDDPERVKNTLNADSNLEIRSVPKGTQTTPPYPSKEAAEAAASSLPGGKNNYDIKIYHERAGRAGGSSQEGWVILEKLPIVTGLDLRDAYAVSSQYRSDSWQIDFALTPGGSKRFGDWTGAHIKDDMAIVLNDDVKSVAVINAKITDRGMIEGSFTQQDAEDLALVLKSGALPAKVTYLEERTVGPSLGADSIREGVTASIAGLFAVVAFMLFYYRLSGVNAVLALLLNLILLLAVLSFGAVLTLPGIAGVILTIGIAVDSNVLIFERIREEMRNGKVVTSAVDLGFSKAFLTIIDTHVTTVVSAVFLFVFGTGPIKGFAVTLTLGLLANLFTAVFVSRTIFMWHLNRSARVETLSI